MLEPDDFNMFSALLFATLTVFYCLTIISISKNEKICLFIYSVTA